MTKLLSKDHTILERPFMEFRPFGVDEHGEKIRDVSGVTVRANVDYLHQFVTQTGEAEAGERAVQELCRLLNELLRDPVYHVAPIFLRNVWHSYGAEFVAYLREFCIILSGDPEFSFNVGREKHLGQVIQVLGRPFPLQQIYRMIPHFSDKFAKGSVTQVLEVTDRSAIVRRQFTERTCQQYGVYRRRCAELICQAFKGSLIATPEKIHHLPPASAKDRTCIANGDDWCEWEVTWIPEKEARRRWHLWSPKTPTEAMNISTQPSVLAKAEKKDAATTTSGADALLPKDRLILERPFMEFRPFGANEDGSKIHDVSGVVVRGNVDFLEEYLARTVGPHAGQHAVEELCRLLNERLRDPVYHVTPDFLRNVWHSYGAEFVAYLREFCIILSRDPEFSFKVGKEKHITPLIQTLGRPFTLTQIYKMYPYFSDKFGRGTSVCEAVILSDRSAILRRKFTEKVYQQVGPYRKRCAEQACQALKGSLVAAPERVHNLSAATVTDRACIVNGDEWCEWEVTWTANRRYSSIWPILTSFRREEPATQFAPDRHGETTSIIDRRTTAKQLDESTLLSRDHTILERPFMQFRPFGVDEGVEKIQDVSGLLVRDNVEYLEECVALQHGAEAGKRAVEALCQLLNARIPDPAYQVSQGFLRNAWNSYSYEFASYLREFCKQLSGDPQFHYNVGKAKHISPLIQTLGRPFSLSQIHKSYPYYAHKYARSLECTVTEVTDRSAVLRLKFPDRVLKQFGPYCKACAAQTCESSKGRISMVPVRVHHLPASTVRDRACIVNGDDYCEWEVTWTPQPTGQTSWLLWGALSGLTVFGFLALGQPGLSLFVALAAGALAAIISLLGAGGLRRQARAREALIQEQVQFVEARHEELREAYLEQEKIQVELRRKVSQLTTLHSAGLIFGSTRDRETLLKSVLQTLIHQLHYDRAMVSRFDAERQVSYDSRVLGVSEDIAPYARSHEVSVTDPNSLEGTVLLQGKPVLIGDIREVWGRLHPRNQQLAIMTNTRSVISVPLKVKDRILGSLTVDRTKEHSLTDEDRALMETVANQVAIALDNVEAYRQIEELIAGLESKVRERTAELAEANDKLKELDRLKGEFFANISHELRTPLTLSFGAFKTLLKSPLAKESEDVIVSGMRNTSRLLYLINELLELAQFDNGRVELKKRCIDIAALIRDIASSFEPSSKRCVHLLGFNEPLAIEADVNQMKKVIYNLLSNAFKFSDPDDGQVWIRLKKGSDTITLDVEDNGIGIPRDQLNRIFERFSQIESYTPRKYEGTGIGLALVKEIVKLHCGTVAVVSEVDQGSTFTITLPIGRVTGLEMAATGDDEEGIVLPLHHEAPSRSEPDSTLAARHGQAQILVVEDNPDMRRYLERLLASQYNVLLAKDGSEGLKQAESYRPDLILTDAAMPQMSGYELLKALRADERFRSTPIIILTARTGREAKIQGYEAGADDYISKPFDENELLARISNVLRLRRQERELAELREEKLKRFLPSQLADLIATGGAEGILKSHRREITVVFLDLRGFTAFAETAGPEDVMKVLHEYQTETGKVISRYSGTLERFAGDGMMIFFNDPVPVPNHGEKAVRMAVEIQQRVATLKVEWDKRGFDLGLGIGIATGYATLGMIGFEGRRDYGAIGTVTNLAARLCSEAQHGQILISAQVEQLVRDLADLEPVGKLNLRGFVQSVPAFNVRLLNKVT
jgi:signal transduction histidine kinase/class 3 adenylate cyclase